MLFYAFVVSVVVPVSSIYSNFVADSKMFVINTTRIVTSSLKTVRFFSFGLTVLGDFEGQ